MKIGDKVAHRQGITGIVKKITGDIVTVERLDLPLKRNCHFKMVPQIMIAKRENLTLCKAVIS